MVGCWLLCKEEIRMAKYNLIRGFKEIALIFGICLLISILFFGIIIGTSLPLLYFGLGFNLAYPLSCVILLILAIITGGIVLAKD